MSDQPTTFFEDLSGSLQYIAYFRFWLSNSRSFYPDSAQASSMGPPLPKPVNKRAPKSGLSRQIT